MMAGRRRFSNILIDERNAIPDTLENQERRDFLFTEIRRMKELEFKEKKLNKSERLARRKEKSVAVVTNPGARSILDKALGK
jgi:hypothetical protein